MRTLKSAEVIPTVDLPARNSDRISDLYATGNRPGPAPGAANGIAVDDVIEAGTANAAWRNMSAAWRGIEAGIQGFCAEAGLTNDQLLALAGGRPRLVELAGRALHGNARADRECKKATWQRLSQAWEVGNQW